MMYDMYKIMLILFYIYWAFAIAGVTFFTLLFRFTWHTSKPVAFLSILIGIATMVPPMMIYVLFL